MAASGTVRLSPLFSGTLDTVTNLMAGSGRSSALKVGAKAEERADAIGLLSAEGLAY
jgi:hypothetical protein